MIPYSRVFLATLLCVAISPAFAQGTRKPIVLEPSPERNAAPWSDAVLDGNTLYLSGYIGIDLRRTRFRPRRKMKPSWR
jgi:2-iminobutanoate/2-iminopropanoate deaminase